MVEILTGKRTVQSQLAGQVTVAALLHTHFAFYHAETPLGQLETDACAQMHHLFPMWTGASWNVSKHII